MKLSLRWRIVLLIAICLAPAVAISFIALLRATGQQLWEEAEVDAVSLADTIRSATRHAMLAFDRAQVDAILEAVSRQSGVRWVRLYDEEGHFRFPRGAAAPDLDVSGPGCTSCHAESGRRERSRAICSERLQDGLRLYYPIRNEPACSTPGCHPGSKRTLGILQVRLDDQRILDKTRALSATAGVWGLIVLAAAIAPLVFAFQWLLGKPLEESLRVVRQIADGNLTARSRLRRGDEWGELLRSLDKMAVAIEDAHAELETLNRGLEREVGKRTRDLALALDAAHESDRAKTQFLAGISHELSTPLQGVIGYSELLLDGIEGELTPEQRHDVEVILRSGLHLLGLVEDLLEVARVESHQRILSVDEIQLSDLIASVADTGRRLASGKPVEVGVHVEPHLPPIAGDARAIHQVLFHLIENAVRHTDAGRVTIGLRREGDRWVEVIVEDTGSGADEESLRTALRGLAPKDGAGGVSVGLSLARRLAELHGGNLSLETTPGKGTRARLVLPISAKQGTPLPSGVQDPSPPA